MPEETPKRSLVGLVSRRPRWGLTWRGWSVALLALLVMGTLFVVRIEPFLALSSPVKSPIMVVEGWISMPSLRAAADRFRTENYQLLCTTGGAFPDNTGGDGQNFAQVTANQFYELGIPRDRVRVVPCGEPRRDRTYTGAVAVREWFKARGEKVTGLNVVTEGVHSRRSRLMFEAAFGDGVAIGVISLPDQEYDPAHWWRYSEGVKEIISESAAYLYARFLFRPEE